VHRVLVEKLKGRRPLRKPRYRWEDNIKMDLKDIRWGTDWIDLAKVMNRRRLPLNVVKDLLFP
jgi:hypothetical protein